MRNRTISAVLVSGVLLGTVGVAGAQDYPSLPVKQARVRVPRVRLTAGELNVRGTGVPLTQLVLNSLRIGFTRQLNPNHFDMRLKGR